MADASVGLSARIAELAGQKFQNLGSGISGVISTGSDIINRIDQDLMDAKWQKQLSEGKQGVINMAREAGLDDNEISTINTIMSSQKGTDPSMLQKMYASISALSQAKQAREAEAIRTDRITSKLTGGAVEPISPNKEFQTQPTASSGVQIPSIGPIGLSEEAQTPALNISEASVDKPTELTSTKVAPLPSMQFQDAETQESSRDMVIAENAVKKSAEKLGVDSSNIGGDKLTSLVFDLIVNKKSSKDTRRSDMVDKIFNDPELLQDLSRKDSIVKNALSILPKDVKESDDVDSLLKLMELLRKKEQAKVSGKQTEAKNLDNQIKVLDRVSKYTKEVPVGTMKVQIPRLIETFGLFSDDGEDLHGTGFVGTILKKNPSLANLAGMTGLSDQEKIDKIANERTVFQQFAKQYLTQIAGTTFTDRLEAAINNMLGENKLITNPKQLKYALEYAVESQVNNAVVRGAPIEVQIDKVGVGEDLYAKDYVRSSELKNLIPKKSISDKVDPEVKRIIDNATSQTTIESKGELDELESLGFQ